MRWQNTSPRDVGDMEQDTAHTLRSGLITLQIRRSIQRYPSGSEPTWQWIVNVWGITTANTIIEAPTSRKAKIAAVEYVATQVDRLVADVNAMKGAGL